MANIRKKISELTALTSASLDTTLVGVDGGTTYKIELDTLADAVTSRVNILDRDRLFSLESVTSSFETKGRSVISSSAQITGLGFISSSTTIPTGTISSSAQITSFGFVSNSIDISSLNSFTSSQSSLNTAFANGINARLQTSSFDTFSQSVDSRLIAATNEQDLSYLTTTGSNIFSGSQTISGGLSINNSGYSWSFESNGRTKIPNITFNSDRGTGMVGIKAEVGREFQIETSTTSSGVGPWSFGVDGTLTAPAGANILRVGNLVTTSSFNSYTASISTASLVTSISNLNSATSSYLTSLSGAISSSSQLTSSFDTRYAISASFVSSSNLSSIRTITSASYAALTPVSGTLYIIIG